MHDLALRRYGGRPGIKENGGPLHSTLALPYSGFSSYERYPTIEEKAACYLYFINVNHVFIDGNKRTSFLSMHGFLQLNGYDFSASQDEAFKFTLAVADKYNRPTFETVVSWIKNTWCEVSYKIFRTMYFYYFLNSILFVS